MRSLYLLLPIVGIFIACNNQTQNQESNSTATDTASAKSQYSMSKESFGAVDGKEVVRYTLTNPNGMSVKIMSYGATVTNIVTRGRDGKPVDVVLGFDSLSGYLQTGNPYFGCVVGRYANRIAGGRFDVEGKTYTLAKNNNGNTLHGGLKALDKRVWDVSANGDSSLVFNYTSPDGEEGFPGNLKITVTYTLNANNELVIDYTATSDKATPVNLTNHSYFNLSGGQENTILDHVVQILADSFTAVNANLIPTGKLEPVRGTAMDFNEAKKVGRDIARVPGGYDHNWVLRKTSGNGPQLAATVYDSLTGNFMEVLTTQPGVQFYTGNFLDGSLTGKNGERYIKNAGLCLETQHFPDSPNQPSFPNTILKPGETFRQTTIYRFSIK